MVNDLFEALVSKVCGVLSSERIVNLKENLNVGFVFVDISISSIDEAANGRLRNPSHHLIVDGSFNTIEDVAAIAKYILNVALSVDLVLEVILPFEDFRELFIIPFLNPLDFMFEQSDPPGEAFRGSEIISPVAEGFEELVGRMMLVDGRVTVVFLSDFDIGLKALREHLLHFKAIGFPDDDAEVG